MLWPGTQRTWEKEKLDSSPTSCTHLGLERDPAAFGEPLGAAGSSGGSVAAGPAGSRVQFPGAGVPGHRGCGTAAGEEAGRRSWGLGSVGEGRDVEIQSGGSLFPSALPALFKIEL